MARQERNNVDYFPFYCEEGKKMFYLEQKYGNDGFAVFVKLLRELAKAEFHYLYLGDITTRLFIIARMNVTEEMFDHIINDLVLLGKIDKELWEKYSVIWCQSFIDSIQDAYLKRKGNCIDRNSLLLLLTDKGVRKGDKSSNKGDKSSQSTYGSTQRKEKEIKEDKKKQKEVLFSEFISQYPNKDGRSKAKEKYPIKEHEKIILGLENQKKKFEALKGLGEFVPNRPMASTWINQKRWLDYQETEDIEELQFDAIYKEYKEDYPNNYAENWKKKYGVSHDPDSLFMNCKARARKEGLFR